jgi:hypothetical protein
MIEVCCRDAALALAIGCKESGTEEHPALIRDGEGLIRVQDTSGAMPMYWPWQFDRFERRMASKSAWRDQ